MLRYEFNKDAKELRTEEEIINPLNGRCRKVHAIWDTGATGTVISREVCDELGLFVASANGQSNVAGSKEAKPTEIVFGILRLSNNATLSNLFTKQVLPDGVDALIGMDMITSDKFSVFREHDRLVMEFG